MLKPPLNSLKNRFHPLQVEFFVPHNSNWYFRVRPPSTALWLFFFGILWLLHWRFCQPLAAVVFFFACNSLFRLLMCLARPCAKFVSHEMRSPSFCGSSFPQVLGESKCFESFRNICWMWVQLQLQSSYQTDQPKLVKYWPLAVSFKHAKKNNRGSKTRWSMLINAKNPI